MYFELFDLSVEVVGDPASFVCKHQLGHNFLVLGEDIVFDGSIDRFSLYSLAALLPLLPAKQRITDRLDWMTSDDEIACPDPNCAARFKIRRLEKRSFSRPETTVTDVPSL